MQPARPRHSLLFALAFAGASLFAAPAFADDAQAHFDKGNAAFEAEKYDEALTEYQAAWKLTKSHDLAYMLGRTETELGKLREAAEHYTYAKTHFPLAGDDELRKNVDVALADVKTHIATIRLKSTTKGVSITLDGVKVDDSALQSELFLDPGKHVVEASAPGHRSTRRQLDLKAGDDEQVTVNLTPETVSPRNPLPGYVMGGVGLVGIVVGAALVGAAEDKKSEAFRLHDEIGSPEGCAQQAAKCKALRDATSATDTFGNVGVAAFVFGGLFGAAAVGYLLIPSRTSASAAPAPDKPAKTGFTLVPVAGKDTGGLLFSGSF